MNEPTDDFGFSELVLAHYEKARKHYDDFVGECRRLAEGLGDAFDTNFVIGKMLPRVNFERQSKHIGEEWIKGLRLTWIGQRELELERLESESVITDIQNKYGISDNDLRTLRGFTENERNTP